MADLSELRELMREFSAARDWGQFHDPKSVLLALVGEVGELAELFQWLPADQARRLAGDEPLRTRAGEELADVLLYLVLLADVLGIDLAARPAGSWPRPSTGSRPPRSTAAPRNGDAPAWRTSGRG